MKNFKDLLLSQLKIIIKTAPKFFKESPISTIFFALVILILIMNIAKIILIILEKKKKTPNQSCKYLTRIENKHDCSHPAHREKFNKNKKDCTGCWGQSFKINDSEAEERIMTSSRCKFIFFFLANRGKNMLPYISFIYTLIITIYRNSK